jgi:hypothetical protein
MIKRTISQVCCPLGAADGPDVARVVVTAAPIHFRRKWTAGPRRDPIMTVRRMRGVSEPAGTPTTP